MFSTRIVLALVVLLALSHVGTCLKCYTCTSLTPNCKDPFVADPTAEKDCPAGSDACWKIKADDVITRSCGLAAVCATTTACESCTTDLCNSSSSIVPSFVVISLLAAVFVRNLL